MDIVVFRFQRSEEWWVRAVAVDGDGTISAVREEAGANISGWLRSQMPRGEWRIATAEDLEWWDKAWSMAESPWKVRRERCHGCVRVVVGGEVPAEVMAAIAAVAGKARNYEEWLPGAIARAWVVRSLGIDPPDTRHHRRMGLMLRKVDAELRGEPWRRGAPAQVSSSDYDAISAAAARAASSMGWSATYTNKVRQAATRMRCGTASPGDSCAAAARRVLDAAGLTHERPEIVAVGASLEEI